MFRIPRHAYAALLVFACSDAEPELSITTGISITGVTSLGPASSSTGDVSTTTMNPTTGGAHSSAGTDTDGAGTTASAGDSSGSATLDTGPTTDTGDATTGDPGPRPVIGTCGAGGATGQWTHYDVALSWYEVLAPEPGAAPLPLVIALHGDDGNPTYSKNRWEAVWEVDPSFVVATPQMHTQDNMDNGGWDDHPTEGRQLVEQVLADVGQRYDIDIDRVYLTGVSAGSWFIGQRGFAMQHIFAAVQLSCGASTLEFGHYELLDETCRIPDAIRDLGRRLPVLIRGNSARRAARPRQRGRVLDHPVRRALLRQHSGIRYGSVELLRAADPLPGPRAAPPARMRRDRPAPVVHAIITRMGPRLSFAVLLLLALGGCFADLGLTTSAGATLEPTTVTSATGATTTTATAPTTGTSTGTGTSTTTGPPNPSSTTGTTSAPDTSGTSSTTTGDLTTGPPPGTSTGTSSTSGEDPFTEAECLAVSMRFDCASCMCKHCTNWVDSCIPDAGCNQLLKCMFANGCQGVECDGPCGDLIAQHGAGKFALANTLAMCVDTNCGGC